MNRYGVIMAGGGGTRFWPLSRREKPKQFLNLTGNDSLVNETIYRVSRNIEADKIFIVTNATQADLMQDVTSGKLSDNRILAEPVARNTAACIGYAAMEIIKKHGDGVMCVVPSDHYIKDIPGYEEVMDFALNLAADTDKLVTIGIKPTMPATGYGYIKYNRKSKEAGHVQGKISGKRIAAYMVEEFVEKPNEITARSYVEKGCYLWNSGMFAWKASVILNYFKELLPDIYECLVTIGDAMGTDKEKEVIEKVYPTIPKESVDYGILEKADDVIMVPGDFGWNDVGSWDALEALYEKDEYGNIEVGDQLHIGSKNCIAYSPKKMVATIGLDNVIIVETDDAILVCDKSKAQDVKQVVELLQEQKKDKYL